MIEIPIYNQTRGNGKSYKTIKQLSEENSKLQQENKQLKEKLNEILRFTKETSYKNLADRWCFTNTNYAQNIIDIIENGDIDE